MFEPHWRHFVVSLGKTHLSLLSTDSTKEDLSQHNRKIIDLDVKNQIKQTNTQVNGKKRTLFTEDRSGLAFPFP